MPDLFTIEENSEIGRFAKAAVDLSPGALIFDEYPFIYGPKSDTPPLCLGCLQPVDETIQCTKCSWPVCGPNCEQLPIHANYECKVFSAAGAKYTKLINSNCVSLQYECITPLRVLIEKERDPQRWEKEVQVMESHDEIRKDQPIWEFNRVNIVDYLRGPCMLSEQFSDELIHKVCGILEVNAFEARTPIGYLIRCLYPKLAILSHNCVSNITHSIHSVGNGEIGDFRVAVRASVKISKNAELHSSYTYSLWPTLIRRDLLTQSKYFDCKCARCTDPTELQTHMGTLKCQKCDNGILLSTAPLSTDPCAWKCTHCDFSTTSTAIRRVYATVQAEIDAIEPIGGAEGVEQRETLYRRYRSAFHPKNAYLTLLRVGLTQLYGKADDYTLEDLPDLILERKVELCRQLLEVLDVVEPGLTRIRGITLYELHGPLLVLAKNEYANGVLQRDEFRRRMQEAVENLREAVACLENEPETSAEGQLGLVAKSGLSVLVDNFEILMNTA